VSKETIVLYSDSCCPKAFIRLRSDA
jgi:hypothetical protein